MPAPTNGHEAEVQLPHFDLEHLVPDKIVFQRPLTYRAKGPALVLFLPALSSPPSDAKKPLDPEPLQKWAEEGFATVSCTGIAASAVSGALETAWKALKGDATVSDSSKLGLIVYDAALLSAVIEAGKTFEVPTALISYGAAPKASHIDSIAHVPAGSHVNGAVAGDQQAAVLKETVKVFEYQVKSPHFVLPQLDSTGAYSHSAASVAHTRSLKFIKKFFDGPWFPLEQIWDEHTAYEFATRAVEKTMGTMVQEPYVNHVPTLTGGEGRQDLTDFYRDFFIFSNPDDTAMELISRTEGIDRIIDEFSFSFTHDRQVDWMFPGIPPTGKKVKVPFISVVNIRGDRLFNEHIWWDHATALNQIGLLPKHVPFQGKMLRLPVAGIEGVRKLEEPGSFPSNEMITSPKYGLQEAMTNGH